MSFVKSVRCMTTALLLVPALAQAQSQINQTPQPAPSQGVSNGFVLAFGTQLCGIIVQKETLSEKWTEYWKNGDLKNMQNKDAGAIKSRYDKANQDRFMGQITAITAPFFLGVARMSQGMAYTPADSQRMAQMQQSILDAAAAADRATAQQRLNYNKAEAQFKESYEGPIQQRMRNCMAMANGVGMTSDQYNVFHLATQICEKPLKAPVAVKKDKYPGSSIDRSNDDKKISDACYMAAVDRIQALGLIPSEQAASINQAQALKPGGDRSDALRNALNLLDPAQLREGDPHFH